jgi:hypothetical protein
MNISSDSHIEIKKNKIGIRTTALIVLLLAVFAAWYGWNTFEQARTQWIEAKIKNALDQSMQSLAETLPRIQITDSNSGEIFYAPDVNAQFHTFDLYAQTLVNLNQDMSVPMIKLTNTSMTEFFGPSNTTLQGQTTVEFPLIAGINKVIAVHSSIQIPHYKSAK